MTTLLDDGAGDGVILVPACNGMQLANKRMAQVRNAGVFHNFRFSCSLLIYEKI